jgi:hypothetical protein
MPEVILLRGVEAEKVFKRPTVRVLYRFEKVLIAGSTAILVPSFPFPTAH